MDLGRHLVGQLTEGDCRCGKDAELRAAIDQLDEEFLEGLILFVVLISLLFFG